MQNMLSKSNLWCQELFQGTYLSKMVELFFSNCRRSVKGFRKQPPEHHLIGNVFSDKGNGCRCEKTNIIVVTRGGRFDFIAEYDP